MRKTIVIAAALATSFAALAAEPLNVKTGQWEITLNTLMSGAPPIPEEALAKMTPEQRAKLEAMFSNNATPRTHKSTECVTKEDLEKPFHPDEDEKCQTTVIRSTGTSQDISVVCKGDRPSTGKMHVEASSPESMKGNIDIAVQTGKSPMQIKTQMSGRWIGPTCKKDD